MEALPYEFVDRQSELDRLCELLEPVGELALDSEADNLHHYETRLCLLQLRFDGRSFLVDALAPLDLGRFWELLEGKLLIMHGSDFDLRLFTEYAGFRATRLFDSMLAAQLLGLERVGLAALLEDNFGVKLPKDSQKSDWSKRPLPEKMLLYAANDVYHLYDLRDRLMGRIRELGREEWLEERCQNQIEAAATGFPERDANAWRIGKSDRLDERGQAALRELWLWREALAKQLDRPSFKVLGNNYLLQLAEAVSEGNWKYAFEEMPPGIRRRKRQGLVEALRRGERLDPATLPRRPRGPRRAPLDQLELERQEAIKQHRNEVASRLGIDPTLIATRSQVAQLARDARDTEGLLPWQQGLLAPCLERIGVD